MHLQFCHWLHLLVHRLRSILLDSDEVLPAHAESAGQPEHGRRHHRRFGREEATFRRAEGAEKPYELHSLSEAPPEQRLIARRILRVGGDV
jgi:hypothetical protein